VQQTPRLIVEPPAEGSRSMRSVLDLDPELGENLEPDARRIARAATVALTFQAGVGELRLTPWLGRVGSGLGLLVVDGILVADVGVAGRTAAELIGAGDLLAPPAAGEDELLTHTVRWRALVQARIAFLDEAFARRIRFWPSVTAALLQRIAQRTCDLNVQRAIAAHPRLEIRLTLLLWHLATRWGKVETGGIRLALPLTHHLLGRLIGAERPSVSHALARLAQSGLVTGHGDEWHLHGSPGDHLEALGDRSQAVVHGLGFPARGIVSGA
jgi:CRP/FNR family transcriptional regulator, cyclic AMP receptor protein